MKKLRVAIVDPNLLKELQITYYTTPSENEASELYGKGFKQSVLEANEAYEAADKS